MHPSPIAQASNPYTKPQARKPGSLLLQAGQRGFANGGTIEGPGTATSDSIPAKVAQTGEPIQVANGERIVSADQDALLLRIAKAMGHKSVDEMFQAGTGKPVGPTVKYSKGKAIKGAASGYLLPDSDSQSAIPYPNMLPPVQAAAPETQEAKAPGAFENTMGVAKEAASDVKDAWNQGDISGAYGKSQRGMLATGVAGIVDATAKVGSLLRPAGNAISNFATGEGLPPAATPTAPATTTTASNTSPLDINKHQTQLPAEAAAISAAPPVSPILGNTEGVSVGSGITRFDTPGKSPLLTNLTDEAGLADNAKLMARGPMTAQNQGAMDGIQNRQDARDQSARNKMRYDKEVAGAQVMNDAGRRLNLEYDLRNGNPQARAVAQALLRSDDATAKDLRGDALTARGQDITANASNQTNKLAQNKDTREGAAFEAQQKSLIQLAALHTELGKETNPAKRYNLLERILALQGKEKPAQFKTTALQAVKNADGSTSPGMVVTTNEQTGEAKVIDPSARPEGSPTPRAEYDKLPKGATYIGTDGQHYTKG